MICSICHKPIGDMCQAHYGDDGGPICTECVVEQFTDGIWRHQQGLMVEAIDDTENLYRHLGEW